MKIEDCEGCLIKKNRDGTWNACNRQWFIVEDIVCPCLTCLVKMMCSNTCDLLEIYRKRLKEYKKDEIRRL